MVEARWAHRGEAPKVYPLFRALVEAEQGTAPGPAEFSRTWGRSFGPGSGFRFAVAEGEGKAVVGCMSLHQHFSTWKGRPAVSLEDFFVLPELRGQGIGRAMLAFADRHARELGAARIELHVRRDNPRAQALYQREGFEEAPYLWLQRPLPLTSPPPRRSAPAEPAKPRRTRRRAGRRQRGEP